MKRIFKTLVLAASLATSFTAFAQDQEIRLFSHRGGRLEHDENTMYAFKKSYEAGYRGYETDIRLTADGKMVFFHDNSLDRCTNATGPIEALTMKQVEAIKTKQGNPICTLDEFLDFFKDWFFYNLFGSKCNIKHLHDFFYIITLCIYIDGTVLTA